MQNDITFSIDESGDASSSIVYSTPVRIFCNMQIGMQEYSWERFRLDKMIDDEQGAYYLADAYGYSVQDVLNFQQGIMEKY